MNPVWFDEPTVLLEKDRLLRFWPSPSQSPEERVNATTRFILYASVVVYAMKGDMKDMRVFMLSALVLVAMWALYYNGAIRDKYVSADEQGVGGGCRKPTVDNPMSNILVSEYGKESPAAACYYPTVRKEVMDNLDNTIPFDAGRSRSSLPEHQRNAASRQFVTMPVSTVPGAQTEFAEWCYGKKFSPLCRSDQGMCDPNARGAQLEAFGGLDPDGDKRSGMTRGTPGNNN